jgi:2-polyprenyl-3-methyl-5-hydroxy-6-metoxy-1,4-benzoquinol methylase
MRLGATQVQLASEVVRTSVGIGRRYQENRHWHLYPKEWIFKSIPLAGKDISDFGRGTGEIAAQLAFLGARQVYALDVTQGLVDATQRRAELDAVSDRIQTVSGMIQDLQPRPVDLRQLKSNCEAH